MSPVSIENDPKPVRVSSQRVRARGESESFRLRSKVSGGRRSAPERRIRIRTEQRRLQLHGQAWRREFADLPLWTHEIVRRFPQDPRNAFAPGARIRIMDPGLGERDKQRQHTWRGACVRGHEESEAADWAFWRNATASQRFGAVWQMAQDFVVMRGTDESSPRHSRLSFGTRSRER